MKKKTISIVAVVVIAVAAAVLLRPEKSEEVRIKKEVAKANHCTADADCAVVTGACPLGCWLAVHKDEAGRIQTMLDDYGSRSTCVYSCIAHEGAACVNGACEVQVPQP